MDTHVAAINAELPRWPGVQVEVEKRGKHRAVNLSYGQRSSHIIIPVTCSDHRRGPRNTVSQLRRTLKDMGATQLERKPATKREERETQVFARLGVNKTSVILSISPKSPLYQRFVQGSHPKAYWSMELRSNPDLEGEPFLAIVKKELPAGSKKQAGIGAGSVNKQTRTYSLGSLRSQFTAMERFGEFTTQEIELHDDEGDVLLFKLPKQRKARDTLPTPPAPAGDVVIGRIGRAPEPEETPPAPEPDAKGQIMMVYQPPKEKISLERAVNIINAYRERMGDDLCLTITKDGKLQAMAKFGAE